MDNKAKIVEALLPVLQLTRGGEDVTALVYSIDDRHEEYVELIFKTGYKQKVIVSGDSGLALIRDICLALY